MPIRIEKDPENSRRRVSRRRSSNASGGSGLIGSLISMVLPLIIKKPKILIPLLIIGGLLYYCSRGSGEMSQLASSVLSVATGCEMNEEVYDEAEVFEPIADNVNSPLPEKVSLLKYAPKRLNQGSQGSCVAWASAYAARTILHSKATGSAPNSSAFSPAFLYNQIALPNCQGSYVVRAMEVMQQEGSVPFSRFGYNEQSCSKQPDPTLESQAGAYKITGYNRLTKGGSNYKTDLLAIKQHLSQGAPVIIGMMVGGSFMESMKGKGVWRPTDRDFGSVKSFGGHAMCVIGYDDYKENGAFQVMNSWGEDWGDKGVFWVSYTDFDYFTREAYGLYPMGDAEKAKTKDIQLTFGLLANNTHEFVPMEQTRGLTFSSRGKVDAGLRFKVAVQNDKACYTYVFGEKVDQSTYVLFPYTPKHSPYCGITGTRLFPKDHSLFTDDKGNMDRFAVVVSEQPLDYNKINAAISAASGNTLEKKIQTVFGQELISNVQTSVNQGKISVDFTFDKAVFATVLELSK